MRKHIVYIAAAGLALTAIAKGLLPCQVYRNGLTNEQIDQILARNPDEKLMLTARDWQGMRFELVRYHNVTNWADTITSSNQFSNLLLEVQERAADAFAATNRLTKAIGEAQARAQEWQDAADAWRNEYADATNRQEAVRTYLLDKCSTGTTLQKGIYKAVFVAYTNIIERVEERKTLQ